MSIPKEKLIIQEIKEILNSPCKSSEVNDHMIDQLFKIKKLVNNYVDPGYIGGPVVGEEIKEKEG